MLPTLAILARLCIVPLAFSGALAVMATSWTKSYWNMVDMEDSTDEVNKPKITVYEQDVFFLGTHNKRSSV